jgi:putative peptide zinc metalloprotease protein
MNLTRALEVALPEIPARSLSDRAPRIPPDVVFKEHIEDGKPIVKVLVPSQECMFSFPPANWALAQLFDGVRSYEEIAQLYSAQSGAQFGVDDVREFAASLEENGFWHKTQQEKNVLLMQKEAQKRRKELRATKSKWGDLGTITFPAVNPDKFLTIFHKYTSFVYTWWFTLLSLGMFAVMAGITIAHWDEIGRDTLQFFNFSQKSWADVGVFYLVAVTAMCWHEIGHGHACKHFGGRVPSMGFLLIYLTPGFYTDTTEGQVMATRYQRMVISLAGAWAELYICTVATVLWWLSPPDTTLHSVAYMMMLVTGIASVLINFNPLMKLDGYFMMSELLGYVDLKENSTAYVAAWVKRHIWKLPVEVPYVPRRRRLGYAVYALLSGAYSYTVLYVVARFVGNVFRNFDPDWSFIPELATAAVVFRSRIRKLVAFMKFLYLDKKDRVRAWLGLRQAWFIGAVAAVALLLPVWHDSVQGRFVLEPAQLAVVRNRLPGMITRVDVEEGMYVKVGEPLMTLSNIPLESNVGRAEAEYQVASAAARTAKLNYANLGPAIQERDQLAEQAQLLEGESGKLQITSPISGTLLTPRLADQLGSFAPAGTELAEVANLHHMRAQIYVSEHDVYRLKLGQPARLEVEGFWRKWNSQLVELAPKSTEIAAVLSEDSKYKGLGTPNFYVATLLVDNSDGELKPGQIGIARIYGERRSAAGLVWQEVRRFFLRKLW